RMSERGGERKQRPGRERSWASSSGFSDAPGLSARQTTPAANSTTTRATSPHTVTRRCRTSAVEPDQDGSGDDEHRAGDQPTADDFAPAEQENRQPDAPERLRG